MSSESSRLRRSYSERPITLRIERAALWTGAIVALWLLGTAIAAWVNP